MNELEKKIRKKSDQKIEKCKKSMSQCPMQKHNQPTLGELLSNDLKTSLGFSEANLGSIEGA